MKSAILLIVLFTLMPVVALADIVISLNFIGGNGGQGDGDGAATVTGVAGDVPAGNWNNAMPSSGSIDGLVDDTGAATSANVSWTSGNTWSATGATPGGGTDADMMSGYLDNFHNAGNSIVVTDLPASFTTAGYDVRVYHNTDSAGSMGITVDDGVAAPLTYYSYQPGGGGSNYPLGDGFVGSQDPNPDTTTAANFTLFTGLTGSTITITGIAGTSGDGRSRPNAVQISTEGVFEDGDGDGLSDEWEIEHDLDPNDNGDVDPVNGAEGDPDADNLDNIDEFVRGTDPRDADSDDDGLGDAVEDDTGVYVDPSQTGSKPLNPDTDGDTLLDGAEVDENPFFSDPNNPDTDGDGLDDASEQDPNPYVTNPDSADTDGDGFSDSAEIGLDSDPTDPNDVPGVGDGTVISVNIAGGNQDAPGAGGGAGEGVVTTAAGIGQLENWNNLIGTSGTIAAINSDGNSSGAIVTWVTNNTWSTSTADGLGMDADMMSGYLDNFNANGSIVIEGLGSEFTESGYEILVYVQNDNDDNTAGFTATDNLGNTDTRFAHQAVANNNWPLAGGVDGYVVSTETDSGTRFPSNVVRLTGLAGSDVTLTGVAGTGVASTRARPNAIQIITEGKSVDSDGDGLPDAWEIEHDLDPNDNGNVDPVNGADGDPDADSLSNIDEFSRGTDPQDPDSDDDGLGDAVEDNTGMYVKPGATGSDPLNPDSDGDTLQDGAEVEENPFFSDPNNPDTDGDGLRDGSEQDANPFVTDPSSEDTDGDGFSDPLEIGLGSDPTDPNVVPGGFGGAATISVNIAGGNENAPGTGVPAPAGQGIVTGNAGIGQLGNWNNAIGTSGTIPALADSDGNATGATFTWATNNTWSTSTADGLGTDTDMMSGYLDNFNANGSIVVEGLGSEFTAGYDVFVYYQNDNNANTGGFTATDNLANTDTRFGHQITANNNYPLVGGVDGYIVSTETDSATLFSANVVRLTGLSGADFTLTGVAGTGVPSIRSRPNAIQVVSKQPAVPLVITAIDYNEATNRVTLTWNSRPGQVYAVDVSTDLTGWPGDVDDSIESQGESTTLEFDGPTNGETRIFYRVRESN